MIPSVTSYGNYILSLSQPRCFLLFSADCVAVIRIGQLVTRHILRDSDDDNDDDGDDDDDGDSDGNSDSDGDSDGDDDDVATTEPVFSINHASH